MSRPLLSGIRHSAADFLPTPLGVVRASKLALFGFVFFRLRRPIYYHNRLSNKSLRRFLPAQIGFVFSNQPIRKNSGFTLIFAFYLFTSLISPFSILISLYYIRYMNLLSIIRTVTQNV